MDKALTNRETTFRLLNMRLAECGFGRLQLSSRYQKYPKGMRQGNVEFISPRNGTDTCLNFNITEGIWIRKSFLHNDILIAFHHEERLFVYDHDRWFKYFRNKKKSGKITAASWREDGVYYSPGLPRYFEEYVKNSPCPICGED